jgi:polysaccharide biosynthesis transport protein
MTDRSALDQLLEVLRWRWLTILVIAVSVIGGAAAYAQQLPTYYEASALVSVEPRTDVGDRVGADIVRLGAPTFVSYAGAPATLIRIAEQLDRTPDAIRNSVRVELESNTATIEVVADDTDPGRAADTANAVAAELLRFRSSDPDATLQAVSIADAVTPNTPAGPPRRLLIALASVLGLGLGVTAGVLREGRQRRLRTTSEIEAVTGAPVLGTVPRVRRLADHPLAAFQDPAVGTALRSIRVTLETALARNSSIAVTSSMPQEGKSTMSALLATALARLDFRVLLVDGDVRQAGLSRSCLGTVQHGLLGVLRGNAQLHDEIQPGWAPTLSVLPTSTDVDAGDVLSQHIGRVEHELRQAYDVVVFDTPPVLGSDEARVLAGIVSHTLLVVSAGQSAANVAGTVAALGTAKAKLLGVIANRAAPGAVPDPYATMRAHRTVAADANSPSRPHDPSSPDDRESTVRQQPSADLVAPDSERDGPVPVSHQDAAPTSVRNPYA